MAPPLLPGRYASLPLRLIGLHWVVFGYLLFVNCRSQVWSGPLFNPSSKPSDNPICNEPVMSGICRASVIRYAYNRRKGRCQPFLFGTCMSYDSQNRFPNMTACMEACHQQQQLSDDSEKQMGIRGLQSMMNLENYPCSLPIDPGSCTNFKSRYGFDPTQGTCVPFSYGGCRGNPNSFETIDECKSTCTIEEVLEFDEKVCLLSVEPGDLARDGHCDEIYSYDITQGNCVRMPYSHCGANINRFSSDADCRVTCMTDAH